MENAKHTTRRRRRIGWSIAAAVLFAAVIGTWIYLSNYYHAEADAIAALHDTTQAIEIRQSDTRIDFVPQDPKAGLIFYPGAKVAFESYAPLMKACAERGVLCVLLQMPGNLAVLDYNAADGIAEDYPGVERWYVGGHSLGANIAATYAAKHADALAGLVMLAGYSTDDLTGTDLQVLSVYGSEDGVLNRDRYARYRANLPADTVEVVIEGGCHSYFGSYGMQEGDGTPTVPMEKQITETADAISEMLPSSSLQDAAA